VERGLRKKEEKRLILFYAKYPATKILRNSSSLTSLHDLIPFSNGICAEKWDFHCEALQNSLSTNMLLDPNNTPALGTLVSEIFGGI
jgi:hypothetical protein